MPSAEGAELVMITSPPTPPLRRRLWAGIAGLLLFAWSAAPWVLDPPEDVDPWLAHPAGRIAFSVVLALLGLGSLLATRSNRVFGVTIDRARRRVVCWRETLGGRRVASKTRDLEPHDWVSVRRIVDEYGPNDEDSDDPELCLYRVSIWRRGDPETRPDRPTRRRQAAADEVVLLLQTSDRGVAMVKAKQIAAWLGTGIRDLSADTAQFIEPPAPP